MRERFVLNGAESKDPNGGALAYSWNLGDGSGAVGAVVERSYESPGTYLAILRVVAGSLAGRDTVVVEVAPPHAARAFASPGRAVHPTTGRGAGPDVHLEPSGVYFYRVETVDGARTGRLTILK